MIKFKLKRELADRDITQKALAEKIYDAELEKYNEIRSGLDF